ncbi:TniQ family protein [Streptomyces europaeiscabiei]|uniref:TniQ family protein n=1 Tax=Streptomyces europaeiscabiei TaxID=146819 RepID=UPI0029A6611B|nr:TniQ family protein [Streptomyces europaeiscabiei]MDX2757253.1 TniQ family protein [Streptomyces europaeiscabiei]
MTRARTLPIRLAPHSGEALDSWWEAVAHRLGASTGDVLKSIGLLPRGASRPADSGILGRLVTLLDTDQAATLAWSAGVTEAEAHAMTLARYDRRVHVVDPQRRRVAARHVWGRARGSRYCPACLTENGGRWLLRWRLGWSFVCLDHQLLLVDACPRCSRIPRHFPATTRHPLAPGRCHSPSEKDSPPTRCGQPFEEVPALTLAVQGPVIAAQKLIEEAISRGRAHFGVYQDHPQPSLALFGDLRALACILLRRVPERLAGFVPPEILALHQQPVPKKRRSFDLVEETRPGRLAPQKAATAALAASATLHILEQGDAHQAGAALRHLIRDADGSIPLKVGLRWAHTSPVFDAVHLATLAPRLSHSDQLRYRTADRLPRRPGSSAATRTTQRAREIPTQLWPAWSARLSPSSGALSRTIRPALSCYLLLIGGARGDFTTATRLLRSPAEDRLGPHMAHRLTKQGHFKAISVGLSVLADYLDKEGSPIDYDRRRATDYRDLLPLDTWTQLCRDIEFEAGGVRRHQFARALLFERISGLPATLAPAAYAPATQELRTMLRTFETDLTPALVGQLEEHAREFLAGQGIHDEPLTWQPPTDIIDGLELPGCDLGDIDLGILHGLIRDESLTTAGAARRLGVSHDAVRFVLQEQPAPPRRSAMWERGATIRRARAALPRNTFARLYLEEYRSLKWIAKHADVNEEAIKVLVREYGMTREGKATRWRQIDLDWLREQRAAGRTCRELAEETGFSLGMISYLGRRHDLPGRRPARQG